MTNVIIDHDYPLESEQVKPYTNPRQIEMFPNSIKMFCLLCHDEALNNNLYCKEHIKLR